MIYMDECCIKQALFIVNILSLRGFFSSNWKRFERKFLGFVYFVIINLILLNLTLI